MSLLTLFPGITPFKGCKESNNCSYLARSEGFIAQSLSVAGTELITLFCTVVGKSPYTIMYTKLTIYYSGK